MNVTFDLAKIEEMMPQQARKQLEAELEKSCCSLGGVRCLYTAILVSPVQSSPVQSSPESRFYRDPLQHVHMQLLIAQLAMQKTPRLDTEVFYQFI